eukprot:1195843-Prorocentrum_minimum.AAC.4
MEKTTCSASIAFTAAGPTCCICCFALFSLAIFDAILGLTQLSHHLRLEGLAGELAPEGALRRGLVRAHDGGARAHGHQRHRRVLALNHHDGQRVLEALHLVQKHRHLQREILTRLQHVLAHVHPERRVLPRDEHSDLRGNQRRVLQVQKPVHVLEHRGLAKVQHGVPRRGDLVWGGAVVDAWPLTKGGDGQVQRERLRPNHLQTARGSAHNLMHL